MQDEGFEFPSKCIFKKALQNQDLLGKKKKKEDNNEKEAFSLANYLRTELATSKGA